MGRERAGPVPSPTARLEPRPATGPPPVIHYRQSLDFTCGPAALLMALAACDPRLRPSRELELDLWRESTLVEIYGTTRFGLALAAHRRGFIVRTRGVEQGLSYVDALVAAGAVAEAELNRELLELLHDDLRQRCRVAGVPDARGEVTPGLLREWLGRGWLPLVLVEGTLVEDDPVPHWVTVTGVTGKTGAGEGAQAEGGGDGRMAFHDPLAPSGPTTVPAARFARHLGYRGVHCAVVVTGRRGPG